MIVTAENFHIVTEILLEDSQSYVKDCEWAVVNEAGNKIREYREYDEATEEHRDLEREVA